jgi:flagellum-specific peptidoglycan hydrolase FlgJ
MSRESFLQNFAPIVQNVAKKRGYKFPSIIIAQAACESSWGNSVLSAQYNNYFGMKAGKYWKGKIVNLKTKEELNGNLVTLVDGFRCYDTIEAGVNGYFDFISTERYKPLKEALTPEGYANKLKECGYATATNYPKVLIKLMNDNGLRMFDDVSQLNVVDTTPQPVTLEIDKIAREVIKGLWGNGNERRIRLASAGYDYATVQMHVNEILKGGK